MVLIFHSINIRAIPWKLIELSADCTYIVLKNA